MTVKQIANELQLWSQIEVAAVKIVSERSIASFLDKIAQIPVERSRATRRLGAYVSRAGEPVCIRIQFAQEPEILKQTFLHEVAHACDHLNREKDPHSYRRAHGPSWENWARTLGISTQCCGESEAIRTLHQQRLKLVAVCQKCGTEFHRVRRLNRNRTYVHDRCGGKIEKV